MLPALSSNSAHQLHLDNNNSASHQQQQQQALEHSQQQQQQQRSNKRSASMIFRIEHLLPSTSRGPPPNVPISSEHLMSDRQSPTYTISTGATSSTSTTTTAKRAKQRATCNGVLLSLFTPKDTLSEAIPTYALMSAGNMTGSEQPVMAYCTLSEGVLRMSPELLRRIKLSEDIHSYNALFELQPGGAVHVRTVRDVARDEELVAWFGEEIALLMSIPFLTPLNIQGNKRYTCHLCQLTFETPNPLKIHLALGCGRHSMDILWIRLHYALKATSYTQHHRQLFATSTTLSATQTPLLKHSPSAAPSSTSSISPASSPQPASLAQPTTAQPQPQHQPQVQRLSAFKPVPPSIAFTAAVSTSSFSNPHSHTSTAVSPSTALSYLPPIASVGGTLSHMRLLQPSSSIGMGPTNSLNAAAQIEAIVSNMGASKQGHLCIYCGKVYSRKYGLKIHIRTHTGFKPLKCKFCLRPFGDPSNLNKHVRLHLQSNVSNAPVEGYKCTLCNKTLARRRDLQRHIESRHSGDGGSS
ncbi:PR domain zinc finger protein 13 [Bactrocera neohumeralis]|uniref:PR domain zinc finger protein 13 n=1 Tax=Bactrocera neohumeralis TaxID=98809 RepID=UPI002165B592|nr:PR domain zinc finger protein 13 [Bactrocera neohumeralis]